MDDAAVPLLHVLVMAQMNWATYMATLSREREERLNLDMSLHKSDLERSSSVTSESTYSVSNSADQGRTSILHVSKIHIQSQVILRAYLRRTIEKITRWLWAHGHVEALSNT
jgi:hypothetical protein